MWPQLTSLSCKQNSFEDMDSSLHLLPRLHAMDLSNNNINVIRNLHHCSCLVDLNLSYNNIESLSPLRECGSHLVRLVLQVCVIQPPVTPGCRQPADIKPDGPVHAWLVGSCCLVWLMVSFGEKGCCAGKRHPQRPGAANADVPDRTGPPRQPAGQLPGVQPPQRSELLSAICL